MQKGAALTEETHQKLSVLQDKVRSYDPRLRNTQDAVISMALDALDKQLEGEKEQQ